MHTQFFFQSDSGTVDVTFINTELFLKKLYTGMDFVLLIIPEIQGKG